jgi:hypothetical protein
MLTLNEESRQHRADPDAFFDKAFEQVFGHYFTPEDALKVWEGQLGVGMWYADDVLHAFRHVLARGEAGLGDRLRAATGGRFSLSSYRRGLSAPTDADYHAWLTEIVRELEARFDAHLHPEAVEEESLVWADSPEAAEAEAREELPFWAQDVRATVSDASAEYGPGAWSVRLEYTLPYR